MDKCDRFQRRVHHKRRFGSRRDRAPDYVEKYRAIRSGKRTQTRPVEMECLDPRNNIEDIQIWFHDSSPDHFRLQL